MLEVACSRCERRGRLRVARLIEQHGADLGCPSFATYSPAIARALPRARMAGMVALVTEPVSCGGRP